ncbi:hypothetical protein [Polaromonas glacialis]|nr:hypothetical protein [Polaromonas glacialis]
MGIKAEKPVKAVPDRWEFGLWEAPHLRKKPDEMVTSMKNADALPNPPL